MEYKFKGKLIVKNDTIQVSENFKKREFVLEKTEQVGEFEFTDTVKFQLTQKNCNLIDSINVDDELNVFFNLRGNKWEKEGKTSYFNNLDVWKIEPVGKEMERTEMPQPPESDDLPF